MQSNAGRAGLLLVLAAVAVVMFIVLSDEDSGSDSDDETERTVATGSTRDFTPPTASIVVKDGEPVGGVKEVEVSRGDQVALEVSSDRAGDVHIHGYEIDKAVKAGGTVLVTFPAEIEGGFEVELHLAEGEAQIAELTVQPR